MKVGFIRERGSGDLYATVGPNSENRKEFAEEVADDYDGGTAVGFIPATHPPEFADGMAVLDALTRVNRTQDNSMANVIEYLLTEAFKAGAEDERRSRMTLVPVAQA